MATTFAQISAQGPSFRHVTRWLDGSPMTDAKCDGVLYRKRLNGAYEARDLVDGRIDMSWYLVGDGITDNKPLWDKFNQYVQQAVALFRLVLLIPGGDYYTSGTVFFLGVRYYIYNYGRHLFPGGCIAWQVFNVDHADFEVDGLGLWLESLGRDMLDGLIDAQDPTYRPWLQEVGIPLDLPVWDGKTLHEYIDKPAGTLIKSLRHSDYKWHGLYSTLPIRGKNYLILGFSGHSTYSYAPAIQQSGPDAPSRYNTSYSTLMGGSMKGCGGYNVAVFGADANSQLFFNIQFYTAGCANVSDLSQAGTHFLECSEQSAQVGGVFLLSGGNPYWLGYCETDARVWNVVSGGTEMHGINNKITVGGGAVQRGSTVTGLNIGTIHTDRLTLGSVYGGVGSSIEIDNRPTKAGNLNLKFSIRRAGQNDVGLLEFIQRNEPGSGGRLYQRSTTSLAASNAEPYNEDFNDVAIQDQLFTRIDGFNPLPGYYTVDDRLTSRQRSFDLRRPTQYRCIATGVWGELNHIQLGSPPAHLEGTQRVVLDGPTALFQLNMPLIVNTVATSIVAVEYAAGLQNREVISFSIGAQLNKQTGPLDITFPEARFQACGERGEGTTAERPQLRPDDAGWTYWNKQTKKLETWNGESYA